MHTTKHPRRTKATLLVGVIALFAIGELTDNGPLLLGNSPAEAVIGRPLTPMSYAGVARRTTRRAAYAGAGGYYGGGYYAPHAYYAPPPVVPTAGVVTTLPAGCVASGGYYACGGVRYAPYYSGATVVYRPM